MRFITLFFLLLSQIGLCSKLSLTKSQQSIVLMEHVDAIFQALKTDSLPPQNKAEIQFNQLKTGKSYWFRLIIKEYGEDQKWVIEAYDIHTNKISLFYKEAHKWKFNSSGMDIPIQQKKYKTINHTIDIPSLNINDTLFFKIDGYIPTKDIYINPQHSFTNYSINEFFFLGIYYGILLFIALYNFMLWILIKQNVRLFYVGYVICSMFYSFTWDGIGYKFIWPTHPEYNNFIDYFLSPLLLILFYTIYSLTFLSIHKHSKKLFNSIILFIIILLIFHTIDAFYWYIPFLTVYTLPFIIFFAIAIHLYRQGEIYLRFYIIGNCAILLALLINVGRLYGWINSSIFTVYSYNLAFVIEMLTMSIALADKFKYLKNRERELHFELIEQQNDNNKLQQKVNLELEEKVTLRTTQLKNKSVELEEKNEKLNALSQQLDKINHGLDYNNWKLGKNIKVERTARFTGEKLSYNDFQEIFPNNINCAGYLRDLKWKSEAVFSCKKCNNNNYSKSGKFFARKCSKCGHIESVTSGTIFHKLRMPLQASFFLVYISLHTDNITLEKLSSLLNISTTSIWKFQQKINVKSATIKSKTFDSIIK